MPRAAARDVNQVLKDRSSTRGIVERVLGTDRKLLATNEESIPHRVEGRCGPIYHAVCTEKKELIALRVSYRLVCEGDCLLR